MPFIWTPPAAADFWNGAVDFASLTGKRQSGLAPDHLYYEPIFVRLKTNGTSADLTARQNALSTLLQTGDDLYVSAQDFGLLLARINQDPGVAGLADEYHLFRKTTGRDPATDAGLDQIALIADCGPAIAHANADPAQPAPPTIMAQPTQGAPIVALIDDGIAFLNERFRRKTEAGVYETRFKAVWLQTRERFQPNQAGAPNLVQDGVVVSEAQINTHLARLPALDEARIYGDLARDLFAADDHLSTLHSHSHGTHVLDLAAGADPDASDPVSAWPLLGVQVPPSAIADTSGESFEHYLVSAMRWVLASAFQADPTAPVIVNISLGMMAGPKDGHKFAEYQIAKEAAQWEAAKGQPVRVVYSFGNNYRSRQVARMTYPQVAQRSGTDREITWRVQPGDLTASTMTIHPMGAVDLDNIQLDLAPPQGPASGFQALTEGQQMELRDASGAAIARIYRDPSRPVDAGAPVRGSYTLALSPTDARRRGEPLAPAGDWTLTLRYQGSFEADFLLQIQRDDSAPGFKIKGRQSYFDDADAYGLDPELQNSSGLTDLALITRQGTYNALVTARQAASPPGSARHIFSVGAATWSPGGPGQVRPSFYSAEGAPDLAPGPVVSTIADDGYASAGVIASGSLSGSAMPANGTSAAAGRLSRALAMSGPGLASLAGPDPLADLSSADLTVTPVPAAQGARLGQALVEMSSGPRPRR